jgi:hypothetical protein
MPIILATGGQNSQLGTLFCWWVGDLRSTNPLDLADRPRRQLPKKPVYAPPAEENNFEPQPSQSTAKRPFKGKEPAKKIKITDSHSQPPAPPSVCPPSEPQPPAAPNNPTFSPITPRISPHKAYNTLPHSVVGLYAVEPMHIFGLFLTPELLRTIKDNTNK